MVTAVPDFEYPVQDCAWNERDVILFGASIGCTEDELQYIYELHPQFKTFPTYPVILQSKGTSPSVIDYYAARGTTSPPIPFPSGPRPIDQTKILDGSRHIQILKALPTTSAGRDFKIYSKLVGMYDKGKSGTVTETESELREGSEVYCRIARQSFAVGQGEWGGPKGPGKKPEDEPPSRKADFSIKVPIREDAARLYRLNGDYNPLHADPAVAHKAGYPRPILHGLCSWNTIACALTRLVGPKGKTLREFQARFASVVYPGDTLVLDVWKVASPKGGEGKDRLMVMEEYVFVVRNEQSGKVALSNGKAVYRTSKITSNL